VATFPQKTSVTVRGTCEKIEFGPVFNCVKH
jgi:hypothetical protein